MLSRQFITAGRAVFTVEIPEDRRADNKAHYTFRVSLKKAKGNYGDTYFVSLLTGPDNTADYSYMGILNPQTGVVRTTQASLRFAETYPLRLINRVFNRIWNDDAESVVAAGFDIHHEGRCGRCGRRLTVPESIETGLGPECAGRV